MTISTPSQLVDEFKKSGEFDRLRRELLRKFQQGDGAATLKEQVEGIARQYLESEQSLQYMSQERVHRALMQEVDRYPFIERATGDVLTDEGFTSSVHRSVQKILRQDRGDIIADEPEEQQTPKEPNAESIKPQAGTPIANADIVNVTTTNTNATEDSNAEIPSVSVQPGEPSSAPSIDVEPPSPISSNPGSTQANPVQEASGPDAAPIPATVMAEETSVDVEMAEKSTPSQSPNITPAGAESKPKLDDDGARTDAVKQSHPS